MTCRWVSWVLAIVLLTTWGTLRSAAQPPPPEPAAPETKATSSAKAACTPEPGPDEGCRGQESQHSYRFALLKHWCPDVPTTIPMYAVDKHPEVPSHQKLLRYCAPAVEPQYLYATPRDRW